MLWRLRRATGVKTSLESAALPVLEEIWSQPSSPEQTSRKAIILQRQVADLASWFTTTPLLVICRLSFIETHRTAEALCLARRPREAVLRGGMIGVNPGNEPGRSPSALDFGDEKINASRSRDEN
jgi:hypothetical protein